MKKLIILLLLLSACSTNGKPIIDDDDPKPPIIDDDPPIVERIEKHKLDAQYDDWGDAIVGAYFFGYGDYTDFDHLHKSPEFKLVLELYENINNVTKVQTNDGEVMMMFISRYEDMHIHIEDEDKFELLNEDNFDVVLLRANQSELRPDVKITITYQDEVLVYEPIVSMMDGHLALPKEIIDLSLYTYPKDAVNGVWKNDEIEVIIEGRFIALVNIVEGDIHYGGRVYFEVPVDFEEEFDNANGMIYFDLIGDTERFEIFGKFIYSLEDEETLLLKHISYDPFTLEDEFKLYRLKLEGE